MFLSGAPLGYWHMTALGAGGGHARGIGVWSCVVLVRSGGRCMSGRAPATLAGR